MNRLHLLRKWWVTIADCLFSFILQYREVFKMRLSCEMVSFLGSTPFFSDLNECGLKPRPCKHRCMNTYGSYKCFCLSGYMLMPDGSCSSMSRILTVLQGLWVWFHVVLWCVWKRPPRPSWTGCEHVFVCAPKVLKIKIGAAHYKCLTLSHHGCQCEIDLEVQFRTRITKLSVFSNVFPNTFFHVFYLGIELFQLEKH